MVAFWWFLKAEAGAGHGARPPQARVPSWAQGGSVRKVKIECGTRQQPCHMVFSSQDCHVGCSFPAILRERVKKNDSLRTK